MKNMPENNTSPENENNKKKGWMSIIKAVKTPLGFFTLVALIVDGLLGTAVFTENVPWWAPTLILVLVIVLVFTAMMINPLALIHPSEWPTPSTVPLIFSSDGQRIDSYQVDLDEEKCQLTVRSKTGNQRYKGPANLVCPHGQWSFRVPKRVKPSDDVSLRLVETNKREWRVKSHPLNEINVEAVQINKDVGGRL